MRSLFSGSSIQLASKKSYPKTPRVWKWPRFRINKIYVFIAVVVIVGIIIIVRYGISVKRQVVEQSSAAVTNLQTAQDDLKTLNFKNASQDFFSAYANFSKAGNSLNFLGAGVADIL